MVQEGKRDEAWKGLNRLLTTNPKNEGAWLIAISLSEKGSKQKIIDKALTFLPASTRIREAVLNNELQSIGRHDNTALSSTNGPLHHESQTLSDQQPMEQDKFQQLIELIQTQNVYLQKVAETHSHVEIEDVNIALGSMIVLLVKFFLASLLAGAIVWFIAAILGLSIGGVLSLLLR